MYELAMASGLIDITHRPKLPRIIATTGDGTKVPFELLQVCLYLFKGECLIIFFVKLIN